MVCAPVEEAQPCTITRKENKLTQRHREKRLRQTEIQQHVKTKVILDINLAPHRKDVWGSGGISLWFLTSALDGNKSLVPHYCPITAGKRPEDPLHRRLDVLGSRH
jgi:hypothetical protein